MASPNPNFDTLISSTLRNYRKRYIENVLGQSALFWQLKQRGFLASEKGGRSLVHPIMHGTNDTVQSYEGYDILNTAPQEGFTSVELDWKQLAVSITISGREEMQNQGSKARIFSLLEGKIKQAELSLELEMNSQIYGDGTGNDSKDITGLDLAVEDGTAWSTYGGIDSSTTEGTFWRNHWVSFSGTDFATDDGKSTEGVAHMRSMYNKCLRGKSRPTLIVTTRDLFEAYESVLEGGKQRITDMSLGEAGFENLTFKGVPIVFDEDCPSQTMFFLNADFIKLVSSKGRNFITTKFMRPENQDAKVAQILWAGNLVCYKRDQQGRIDDFVA